MKKILAVFTFGIRALCFLAFVTVFKPTVAKAVHGTSKPEYLPVAIALRQTLIEVNSSRLAQQGQHTKMEQVYQYLTRIKFRQRVEAVVEKFNDMRDDLDKGAQVHGPATAKRETQILSVIESTVGMVGDLQAIGGNAMPEIPSLDMQLLESSTLPEREASCCSAALLGEIARTTAGGACPSASTRLIILC